MNIREHILAGHYPTDDKGRALVPTGHTFGDAVICATDKPGPYPILGWLPTAARVTSIEFSWDENGWAAGQQEIERLLPPPARKVKVTRYALYSPGGTFIQTYATEAEARAGALCGVPVYNLVILTGEYEEPWS